jgi:hypothetical protein
VLDGLILATRYRKDCRWDRALELPWAKKETPVMVIDRKTAKKYAREYIHRVLKKT